MATDQKSSLTSEPPLNSAIENELPTYRAVSSRAVLSLICGLLGLLAFANPFFFVFAALAAVLGITADRNIQRYPDILTGRRIAQTGVFLGVIFGLGIATMGYVQGLLIDRAAAAFAREYAAVVKEKTLAEMLWMGTAPATRKEQTPQQMLEQMNSALKGDSQKDAMSVDMRLGPLRNLKKKVDSSKDTDFHFVRIERHDFEGLTAVALALFELHGPKSDTSSGEEFAAAILKGIPESRGYGWYLDDLKYPHKPSAGIELRTAPAGDGHGHAH